jgi:lysyl-tRNA synthetase class 2
MIERNESLFEQRKAKLQRLRDRGIDPYPITFHPTHSAAQAVAVLETVEAAGQQTGPAVTVAGRIVLQRPMGGLTFLHLRDSSGDIQVMLRQNELGEDRYGILADLDLGDFLGVTGPCSPSHSSPRRRSGTASPTWRSATGAAIST